MINLIDAMIEIIGVIAVGILFYTAMICYREVQIVEAIFWILMAIFFVLLVSAVWVFRKFGKEGE